MILMARILTPADYGIVGMLAIFIAISQSLVDSGFSQALIRKQDRSEIDNSTVFYFNIAVGIVMYLILFFSAPLIADFYSEPLLVPITRAIGLSVVFNSLVVVQRALLTVNLDFKTQAKASLVGAVISGAIGISMAYTGFGVWAIVWQQLSNLAIVTILLWILAHWKPIWAYSWKSFKELFGFGSKLAISSIIDTLYKNIYLIVIGKVFNASDLGYYTRASQFAQFPSSNFTGIIQRVTYPILCTLQGDAPKLKDVYRRFLRLSAFIVFPLMVGLAAVAKPLILFLLNEQWAFCIILLQIICFSKMWYPIHAINLSLLQVQGRSDLFLKLEIIQKIIGVSILCITVPMGLITMCIGGIFVSIIDLIINTHYTGKLIHLGFFSQMKDLLPTLLLSLATGGIVYLTVSSIQLNSWLTLGIGIVEGVLIYTIAAKILRFSEFSELLFIIRRK